MMNNAGRESMVERDVLRPSADSLQDMTFPDNDMGWDMPPLDDDSTQEYAPLTVEEYREFLKKITGEVSLKNCSSYSPHHWEISKCILIS